MLTARFPIGTKYTVRRKGLSPQEFTVTDILYTYNSKGELIKIRYVAQRQYLGQTLTDYDVLDTTIARCLFTN
jgi:hypothetical protein